MVFALPGVRAAVLHGQRRIALNRSTFTAANGTRLNAITPEIGGAWTELTGTWQVQSNAATTLGNASDNQNVAICNSGSADAIVEITTPVGNANNRIVLRSTGVIADGYFIFDGGGKLYEFNGTTYTQRASGTYTSANGDRIVAICVGSTITIYANNVQICTYASATRNQTTGTYHGIGHFAITSGSFDNFIVWPRTVTLPAGV